MVHLCWWCCHEIPGTVLHMPIKYKSNAWTTRGQFCSWECMKSYNNKLEGKYASLIMGYRKQMCGKIEPIRSAPDKMTLVGFGGRLTIDEFRKGCTYAWVSLPNEMHQAEIISIRNRKDDDDLVLRRDKPLRRDKNSIKNVLGINQVKK